METAGIYLHIPFCKQACHYCDFHFSTQLRQKSPLLKALAWELHFQRIYLDALPVSTIYLGGGTPSLLTPVEVASLLKLIDELFICQDQMEITLEVNPDDLTLNKLYEFKLAGINRLSIGIQSFQPALLKALNRVHDRDKALRSVDLARETGFHNFSIDLMYAIPGSDLTEWKRDLAMAVALKPPHIAAYCLTIESRTAFERWQQQGKLQPVADEEAAQQFDALVSTLTAHGYEHYEVSNLCLPGYYAQHNMNYWKRGVYLGVGPGAHSYNGKTRQHNVANNQRYIDSIHRGVVPCTVETLCRKDHINEYIMTSLRTQWGCSLAYLWEQYWYSLQRESKDYLESLVARKLAVLSDHTLVLTPAGRLLVDQIATDLFVV
ncbi:MAG: radical SAM family heme chaperone HemW [Bacteroidota bacterium]